MKRFALISICLAAFSLSSIAGERDSVAIVKHHIIETFRPLYLETGIPVSEKPSGDNADIKFQLSMRLNICHDLWGKEFEFFVGYTQISVWNFYQHSSPFYDNTYMPGVYTRIPLRSKKTGEQFGDILCGYEHRSNGRSDEYSRSVNYGFVSYTHYLPHNITLQALARIGDSWYGDTHSLVLYNKYLGYLQLSADYVTPDRNWDFMVSVSPLFNRSVANVTAEIGYRIGRKRDNPFLFIQYHHGYDEAMRDCSTAVPDILDSEGYIYYNGADNLPTKHMLRFGVMITPGRFMRGIL